LAAHALVHGAVVGLVFHMFGAGWTWVTLLFLLESGAHALIDWGKCQGWYGIHIDQGLHLLCKCVWCSLGLGGPALQGGL
ncbi:MAG: hypothetical protein NZ703_02035, partial [Gemmataceae bacterium]|nr:hypothetical protein [Gemmataceae bacterium]